MFHKKHSQDESRRRKDQYLVSFYLFLSFDIYLFKIQDKINLCRIVIKIREVNRNFINEAEQIILKKKGRQILDATLFYTYTPRG